MALGAQGLSATPPSGTVQRRHLLATMRRLELLQLDSVPAVIRTQYLPLFSRLGSYRSELLDEIAYKEGAWFEAWSHEASLLPVEMEPWLRWQKVRARTAPGWKPLAKLATEEPAYVQSVRDEVADRGPLAASELGDPRPPEGGTVPHAWWGKRSMGQRALDWLFVTGELGVRRVGNFQKRYELLARIVPEAILATPTPSEAEALKALLLRAAAAHGVATADDLVDYFRLPKRESKALLPELVEAGLLTETTVEGWVKPAFRHPKAKLPRAIRGSTLLSPFDPVIWFRERAQRLFDFHYRIEIYTPADKRQFGYYVLPMLNEGRLVARFDLKTLRERRLLHVKGSFVEAGVAARSVAKQAHGALVRLASFVGADGLRIEARGNLATALKRVAAGRS